MLRDQGITAARVYSSRWFRCLDTAELLALGPVQPLAALDSFFQQRSRGPAQMAELQRWLAAQPRAGPPLILVTHQVNITALLDIFPAEGELIFAAPDGEGGWEMRGRLSYPN